RSRSLSVRSTASDDSSSRPPPTEPRLPVEQSCFWLATQPEHAVQALGGEERADVTIVGAGFTGLWTAIFLKELEPALSLAILEQGGARHGASGRNAGILGETLEHSHEPAAAHSGIAEARELARVGRDSLDELARFLEERRIDAEVVREGQLVAALTPAHVAQLNASVAFAQVLGLEDWRFLSAD